MTHGRILDVHEHLGAARTILNQLRGEPKWLKVVPVPVSQSEVNVLKYLHREIGEILDLMATDADRQPVD